MAKTADLKKPTLLAVGTEAPAFRYRDAAGEEHDTAELSGSYWLVYFYPRDNTPGCTREACAFRDAWSAFEAAGLTVIGVSADSEASHAKFRAKHDLPFPLAADEDRSIVNAYQVWGEKLFMGRILEGIHRVSYLVGPDGNIINVYPKVKPDTHASEILADAKGLPHPL